MTRIPEWWPVIVGVAGFLLPFLGAMAANALARRADDRLDRWRRREETMRMLRWSAEQAVAPHDRVRGIGVAALAALNRSELRQPEDAPLIEAILDVVLAEPFEAYGDGR
ncbi:MAG: hypothetical protein ACOYXW_07935 [Actinomycetota bacterium]